MCVCRVILDCKTNQWFNAKRLFIGVFIEYNCFLSCNLTNMAILTLLSYFSTNHPNDMTSLFINTQ
jgi:hypothetical protein